MLRSWATCSAFSACALACAGGDPVLGADAGRPSPDAGTAPSLPCPAGATLAHYSFTELAALPTVGDIALPHLLPNTIIATARPGTPFAVRLDVCEGATRTLAAVMVREDTFEPPRWFVVDAVATAPTADTHDTPAGLISEIRVPAPAVSVQGLDDAVAGRLDALQIRVAYSDGIWVVGHPAFLAVARGDVSAADITYNSLTVIVGGLAPGDSFAGQVCPFTQQPLSAAFSLGTAQFTVTGCSFLGGGETTGYTIHTLSVEDSSAALDPGERRRFTLATEAELTAALDYRWNHHNACDSFHLTLPHAEYAASASPLAGCGEQVPGAPMRTFDEPFDSPVKYRLRYHGGAWVDGTIEGCRHYLFCAR